MNVFGFQMRQVLTLSTCALCLLGSCSSGYRGYKMRPYTVRGERYHPISVKSALSYKEVGVASWYNESRLFGLKRGVTAIGEKMMPWDLSGAHKTLPLPCVVKVTNLSNGRSVKLRINDRGPFIHGRLLDVSPRAAKKLGFYEHGLAKVRVEVLSVGDGQWKRKKRRFLFFF